MAKEKTEKLSLSDFGKLYFESNKDFDGDHVFVTSDFTVFPGGPKGLNSAVNHSNGLEDKKIEKVNK